MSGILYFSGPPVRYYFSVKKSEKNFLAIKKFFCPMNEVPDNQINAFFSLDI